MERVRHQHPEGAPRAPSGKGNRVESNTSAASLRMAQWVGALSPGHIPAAVRQAAVSCILDTVGVGGGGGRPHPPPPPRWRGGGRGGAPPPGPRRP